MRILLLFSFLLICLSSYSQGWYRMYGGEQFDYGHDIAEMPDSGFLVTGMSGSFTIGHAEAFVMKIDKYGNNLWSIPYGSAENDAAFAIKYKPNFGVYILGRTTGQNGDFDSWMALLDENGNTQWDKVFDGEGNEEYIDGALTQDSGLIVAIREYGSGVQGQGASLIRLNSQGDTLWSTSFDQYGDDEITNIESYQDSLFIVTSNHLDTVSNEYYGYLQMMHEDGAFVWGDTVAIDSGSTHLNDFYIDGDTLYSIGTWLYDDTSTFNVMRHTRRMSLGVNGQLNIGYTQSAGNIQGDVVVPILGTQFKYTSFRFQDIALGQTSDELYLGLSGLFVEPLGVVSFTQSTGPDRMHSGYVTQDGGAIFVGYQSLENGGTAVGVAKIGPNWAYPIIHESTFVWDLVNTKEIELDKYVQIYPNPATSEVNIEIMDLEASGFSIMDINGRLLKEGFLHEGKNKIELAGFDSGVYLLQINEGNSTLGTKRIVVQ